MGRQRFPQTQARNGSDVEAALSALDANALRSFIGETLERLGPEDLLFPAFAWILASGNPTGVRANVVEV